MEMTDLPKDLTNIVHGYKYSAEHHDKFSAVVDELNINCTVMFARLTGSIFDSRGDDVKLMQDIFRDLVYGEKDCWVVKRERLEALLKHTDNNHHIIRGMRNRRRNKLPWIVE